MSSHQSGPGTALPLVISVDDHVIEPAHLFSTWLPSKYRERGPQPFTAGIGELAYVGGKYRITTDPEGQVTDWWRYEGEIFPYKRIIAAVGFSRDEMTLEGITREQMRRGCWDPKARLDDMTLNHVEASLCFPTFPRFCGQTFAEAHDKEVALACVRAYNDWMVEEWCGDSGGRLIPLCLIPLWDVGLAVKEIRRNAARGVRAVTFSEIPTYLGLPSIHSGYWDPFWRACAETGTSVNMHIGSSSKMPTSSRDAPNGVGVVLTFANSATSLVDFLFSGVLVRFPALRLAYSEGQIGWLPYVIERIDDVWEQHRAWAGLKDLVPEPPSTYYYRQVYGCFFRDRHGARSLDVIGEDNVLFEVDYPHTDSTWPDTKKIAEHDFAGLSPEVIHKIVRGNAIRLYQLDLDD